MLKAEKCKILDAGCAGCSILGNCFWEHNCIYWASYNQVFISRKAAKLVKKDGKQWLKYFMVFAPLRENFCYIGGRNLNGKFDCHFNCLAGGYLPRSQLL